VDHFDELYAANTALKPETLMKALVHARDIILVFNSEGSILYANIAASDAYGYNREKLCKLKIRELIAPELRDYIPGQVGQDGISFRTVHLRQNGDTFPAEANVKIIDEKERIGIAVIRDISNTVAIETELQASVEKYRLLHDNLRIMYERLSALEEELRLQNEELRKTQIQYEAIFDQAPIGIAILRGCKPSDINELTLVSINPMYESITGRTKEEILRLGWEKITHPDDLDEQLQHYNKLLSGEITSYTMDKRYIRPDGTTVWVRLTIAPLYLNDNISNFIHLVQDITKRKEVENQLLESERSKSVLLSHLPGLAYRCKYDREWTMQYISAGCFNLTGYSPEALIDNSILSYNDIITPEYRELLWKEWERTLASRLPFKYEYEITTAKGERKWVLELGEGFFNKQGDVEALEGIVIDISDRKTFESMLRYSNEHDRLTGLYNSNYLEGLINNDNGKGLTVKRALVGINLSALRSISTAYGFHYTQDLMKKISDILRQFCTEKHLLFDTYLDRFVFYVKDYKDINELLEFNKQIAEELAPIVKTERLGCGIGIVEISYDNELDADLLLKKVLIASEKAISLNNTDVDVCLYDADMEAQIMREEMIKHELSEIAEDENDNGLFLMYQPILDLHSNRICGFEALARLNSVHFGLVPPLEFIPIAEKTKLIIPIGQKIIRQAFLFINKLKKHGFADTKISINISIIQLLQDDFCKRLFGSMREMQIHPNSVSLELTESLFALNDTEINRILIELDDFGIRTAIDDFGTGYSSLSRERELKVHCLKIDKYFIDKLLADGREETITSDIVSMAHKLGHSVIAEGVEHKKQFQYLLQCGCDMIQGYLISKPLHEEAAIELLKETHWARSID
jgi:PAS domain S-box-containing protein